MQRITKKNLDGVCRILNKLTGSPSDPWTRSDDGTLTANVGNWYVAAEYRCFRLLRMSNERGGVSTNVDVSGTAREVWDGIRAINQLLVEVADGRVKLAGGAK